MKNEFTFNVNRKVAVTIECSDRELWDALVEADLITEDDRQAVCKVVDDVLDSYGTFSVEVVGTARSEEGVR